MSEAEAAVAKKRTWRWIVLGACCGLLVVAALLVTGVWAASRFSMPDLTGIAHTKKEARDILSLSNHSQILSDCRRIMAEKSKFKNLPYIVYGQSPDWQLVPTSVRALNFTMLIVGDDGVVIEKGGGLHHFGFKALPEGSQERHKSDEMENWRELIPGLWFYEERDNAAVL